MGSATAAARLRASGFGYLRAEERALLATAGTVFAVASAGAAMSGAAADAMFLAEIGPSHLGHAVAVSSALLAIVLAVVGGLADRLERRRVLTTLAILSAGLLAALAAFSTIAPRVVAITAIIGGKQLAAATDLAFWIVIAERIDARRSQRVLPILALMGGVGAAVGAVIVIPLAPAVGANGLLVAAAGLLAVAGIAATRLSATRRVAAPPTHVGALIARSWRDGARAVRRHPLAAHLALVVAAAGVFASLAYFALGVEVAARGGTTGQIASLLGGVRGGAQIVTLVVQLFVARGLLSRIGTGRALLLAPLVALASGLGLVIAPILAVAIATQASAKVLDSAIESPAEKLAQTLLPTVVRGRVGGFLEGTAKRAGAVVGGVIAAVLATQPGVFYVITAVAAGIWLIAAIRIARELPTLAIEHVTETRPSRTDALEEGAVIDDRAVQALIKELDGPRPERAADVLVRLHDQGRTDAVTPLVKAATETGIQSVWSALVATLDAPAEVHGKALLEAAQAARPKVRELAIRALGLAGGAPPDVFEQWLTPEGTTLALTAEVARLRTAGNTDERLGMLGDASREADPIGRVAIDELVVEIRRQESAGQRDRVLEAARHLTRALRRGRGDGASRTAAFAIMSRVVEETRAQRSAELSLMRSDLLELVRDRVEQGASKAAPDTALVSLIHKPMKPGHADEAVEVAAALRLYGELLEGADVVDAEDLRRITRALGEPDDEVRVAAEAALVGLGPAAAGELLATVAYGRRRARDRAAALLADLPVTPATIDRLVDAELDALEQTAAAITVFTQAGDELVARRLDERLREIAHTVLLLVAARRQSRAISKAAVAWQHSRAGQERARALAVIEAAMPRALVTRLVEAVDDLTPADRKAALVRAGAELPAREAVVRAELAGRDRLARALVLHVLGAADRSAHRDTIAKAAQAEVLAASPTELLRRLTKTMTEPADAPVDEGASDMPSRVETLIALGRVPLLAALSTRQLADVAERARWVTAREGSVLVSAGDPIDALIVVEDGELQVGERRVVKGEVVDELACVAPAAAASDLTVMRSARLIRLERVDFEELVDDVPGLASSVCRALGERARRAEDSSYRSPLASRVG